MHNPKMKSILSIFLSAFIFFSISFISHSATDTKVLSQPDIDTTSVPSSIDLTGLPNFHKVTDILYRGAQPTEKGFKELPKLGIKTIINLRDFHSDEKKLKKIHISYEEIPMESCNPKEEDVVHFLKIITDKTRTPVFVHCKHGSDRTGMICAVYRIAVCGWTKEDAIKEMTKGGFGFHEIWFVPGSKEESGMDGVKLKHTPEVRICFQKIKGNIF